MLDHRLRVYKDVVLRPLAAGMENVPPNLITLLAALLGLAAAGAAEIPAYGLARRGARQSDFGGYLDIVLDFAVYAAVPIGLYVGNPSFGIGLSLLAGCVPNFI